MLANMSVLLTNNIQHVLIVNTLNELQNESCSISRNKRDLESALKMLKLE